MSVKFTRYFSTIESTTLFRDNRFLIIAVLVVVAGALRPMQPSKGGAENTWLSALAWAVYTQHHLNSSTDINYFIPEDDKLSRGKFTEFAGTALLTDFKRLSDSAIDRDFDDNIYSVNPLPYNSSIGFTPLRSPPSSC
jgi:hypothetical protein